MSRQLFVFVLLSFIVHSCVCNELSFKFIETNENVNFVIEPVENDIQLTIQFYSTSGNNAGDG